MIYPRCISRIGIIKCMHLDVLYTVRGGWGWGWGWGGGGGGGGGGGPLMPPGGSSLPGHLAEYLLYYNTLHSLLVTIWSSFVDVKYISWTAEEATIFHHAFVFYKISEDCKHIQKAVVAAGYLKSGLVELCAAPGLGIKIDPDRLVEDKHKVIQTSWKQAAVN